MEHISTETEDEIENQFNTCESYEGVSWDKNYNFSLDGTQDILHFGGHFLHDRIFLRDEKLFLNCSARININNPVGRGMMPGAPSTFIKLFEKVSTRSIFSEILEEVGYPKRIVDGRIDNKIKPFLNLGSIGDIESVVNNIFNIAIIKLHYGGIIRNTIEDTEESVKPLNKRKQKPYQSDPFLRSKVEKAAEERVVEYYTENENDNLVEDIKAIYESPGISETTKETLIEARLGQGQYRRKLIDYWKGCAVTTLREKSLLRASHIKPWRNSNDEERLDVFNGLLLIPNLDLAFDLGYITFDDDGDIIISDRLTEIRRKILKIHGNLNIKYELLREEHQRYMQYHREHVFEKWRKK